jgi:hypothetical protein
LKKLPSWLSVSTVPSRDKPVGSWRRLSVASSQYDLLVHFTLGSLLGVIEMTGKPFYGLSNDQAIGRMKEIAKEYEQSRGIAIAADQVQFRKESNVPETTHP